MSLSEKAGQGAQVEVGRFLSNSYHRQPPWYDKCIPFLDFLSGLARVQSLTTPLVFGFKICMRTPCQIWGNLCKLLYLAYLLPVFSVNLSIYVNHLRLDTFLFTWWIIMYSTIWLPMKIHCSVYFLDFCCYLFFSATIFIRESFLKTSSTAV